MVVNNAFRLRGCRPPTLTAWSHGSSGQRHHLRPDERYADYFEMTGKPIFECGCRVPAPVLCWPSMRPHPPEYVSAGITGLSHPPPTTTYRLRLPGDLPSSEVLSETGAAEKDAEAPEEEAYIVCRQCRRAITRSGERISVQGGHRHAFANPHGLVFDIGCFRNAVGCGYAGPASDEFTWFAGYRWRVCFCGACLTHLGWLFVAAGGDAFHGLILERLLEPQ